MSRYRSILCCFAVITGAFLAADSASAQTTWRVDDDAPGDPASGDPSISDPLEDGSAAHPFDAIQEAIDIAVAGDEVLIADGTYTGLGNRWLLFGGKAIAVRSASGNPELCIIDCERSGLGFYFNDGEGPDSIVQGLTITNGYADHCGGIRCFDSSPMLVNCVISGNTAIDNGGAVWCSYNSDPIFHNCRITDNTVVLAGAGGVYCRSNSNATFTNCTISGNSAPDCGGVLCEFSEPTFANSILWKNPPAEVCVQSGSISLSHCDIYGGWPGYGNIDADPLFVDPDGPDDNPNTWEDNDYRLGAGSPCIDAGCNCAAPLDLADLDDDGDTNEYIPFDIDGEGRFFDDPATTDTGSGPPPVIDMGAYEFGDADPQPIFGDFNGDGIVGLDDLAILLANYGTTSGAGGADGDMYCDGGVSLSDLGAFLATYAEAQP